MDRKAIRKLAVAVFTLDDYAAAGIMTTGQAAALHTAIASRKNILVACGTSTGKTTLTNALLAEIAGTIGRIVLIEDIPELQRCAPRAALLHSPTLPDHPFASGPTASRLAKSAAQKCSIS